MNRTVHLLFALLFLPILGGCDETVSPFVGEERPFTVYGYLDPTTDTQVLRVIPISENINEVGLTDVNAQVRTIHQETNETIVWQKRPTLFSDSTEGVVFTANFTPAYENTYRLEITSEAGEVVRAETTVPRDVAVRSLLSGNVLQPGFFLEGELPNLVQLAMSYDAVALQPGISELNDILVPLRVSYRGEEEASDGGWAVRANLRQDRASVIEEMASACITTPFITVRGAEFEFFIGDDQWVPPGGVFDPEILVQPGTFSNIENGFGYFGSGYSIIFAVRLTSTLLNQIGYNSQRPCQEGPGPPVDPTAPECQDVVPCFE